MSCPTYGFYCWFEALYYRRNRCNLGISQLNYRLHVNQWLSNTVFKLYETLKYNNKAVPKRFGVKSNCTNCWSKRKWFLNSDLKRHLKVRQISQKYYLNLRKMLIKNGTEIPSQYWKVFRTGLSVPNMSNWYGMAHKCLPCLSLLIIKFMYSIKQQKQTMIYNNFFLQLYA
jgi:hypothetical protein